MSQEQKYLKGKSMLVLLAFISAFPPLSTDLYLPALPHMREVLNTTQYQVNLTLSLFFLFFAGGLLFWGPLSDKFGRKPVLMTSLAIYVVSSVMCGFAETIDQLIFCRIFQAFGGSGATAVATALVKDLYGGKERERIMAVVMSMVIIAPIVAPVIGAALLKYFSWRAGFWALGGVGLAVMAMSLLLTESLVHCSTASVVHSWGRLGVVLKNPDFAMLLVIFSATSMFIMSFLAASSFVYINGFGLTEQQYSYFLAFNALFGMAGPMLYMRISKYRKPQEVISTGFPLLIICGLAVGSVGEYSPFLFALTAASATVVTTVMRVPGTNLMLEQQQNDSGSASALINFSAMLVGSLGMHLVSLNPDELIWTLGTIQFCLGVAGSLAWFAIRNKAFVRLDYQKG